METTFISIHDLSADARLLYTSDSIVDILGYTAQEVIGRSCFDYFHPDEIPFARSIYGRGVQMDKAAVLNYCRIRGKYGNWVGCECVFTVVYDVLVGCTSIYRRGIKSQKRAVEAPIIRRLFSASPRDPRYHMLSHLSAKFTTSPSVLRSHEPRAALFLNRFTRTLAIMYATTAVSAILGVTADEAKGKSFYECIQENCLHDAIRCLEGAKANDSIAYLRFWSRDPRRPGAADQAMTDFHSSDEDDDGGVHLNGHSDSENESMTDAVPGSVESRSSSGTGTDLGNGSSANIFGEPIHATSSNSSISVSDDERRRSSPVGRQSGPREDPIEVEAVVSCTSDGLVVILRRARPIVTSPNLRSPPPVYANGLFASPWAAPPIMPRADQAYGLSGPFLPEYAQSRTAHPGRAVPVQAYQGSTGPPMDDFMNSIREVAVFAWSLTGINGSLSRYGRGIPMGESQPPGGMPTWDTQLYRGDSALSLKGENPGPSVDHLETRTSGKWAGGGHVIPFSPASNHQALQLHGPRQAGHGNRYQWL